MNYTTEQIKSIQKTYAVFESYIKSKPDIDFIYSKKAGYLLLYGIKPEDGYMVMEPLFITDGRKLCDFFLYEIACDVLGNLKSNHDVHEVTSEERALIEKVYEEYLVQLPEYEYLVPKQFLSPEEKLLQEE